MLPFQKKLTNGFFVVLSLPVTAVGFSFSTQVAVLSWILSSRYNLHIEDVALVWLAGPISGIIVQPVVGVISDNFRLFGSRRKPFIAAGGILGMLMFLCLLNIDQISALTGNTSMFVIAASIALLLDISINVTFNPARAIIADVTDPGVSRTKGYAWMQVLSGGFSIAAYFISIVFGNVVLIYVAAGLILVFSTLPLIFITEPVAVERENVQNSGGAASWKEALRVLRPLYGFLVYGIFVTLNKGFLDDTLSEYETPLMAVCIILSLAFGIFLFAKGGHHSTSETEFSKMLLAHAFTWLGVQSVFVMCFFYVRENILSQSESVFIADIFSRLLAGESQPRADATAGNILSLGFLILNFVGALLPVLVLQPLSRKWGRIHTYVAALTCMMLGYGFIYLFGSKELNFYIGMFACGVGWSAIISLVFAIMTEKVDPAKMGLYMGLFNLSIVLPAMMTVGVSRIVSEAGDHSMLFMIAFFSLLISVLLWLFVKD